MVSSLDESVADAVSRGDFDTLGANLDALELAVRAAVVFARSLSTQPTHPRPSHPTRTPPASAPTPGRTSSTLSPTSPRTTSEPPAPSPTARPPHRSAPRPRCSRRWNAPTLSASGGRSRSSAHGGPTRTQGFSTAWRVSFGSPRSKRRVGRSQPSIRQSLRR